MSIRCAPVALLTCLALLASGVAEAQARTAPGRRAVQPSARNEAGKLAALDSWMRRLPGRYRLTLSNVQSPIINYCGVEPGSTPNCRSPDLIVTSQVTPEFRGHAECWKVGSGPGVGCKLDVTTASGMIIPQLPRIMLFGLDPADPGIQALVVDGAGPGKQARGELSGDTVSFSMECNSTGIRVDPVSCTRKVGIRAFARSRRIEMVISAQATLRARRQFVSTPGATMISLVPIED